MRIGPIAIATLMFFAIEPSPPEQAEHPWLRALVRFSEVMPVLSALVLIVSIFARG
jgi:hypothetical protein